MLQTLWSPEEVSVSGEDRGWFLEEERGCCEPGGCLGRVERAQTWPQLGIGKYVGACLAEKGKELATTSNWTLADST